MTDVAPAAAPPVESDVVEIIDPRSGAGLKARVESAREARFVLRLEHAAHVPADAPVRWFDGETAWQAASRIDAIDDVSVSCLLAPPPEWIPAPIRKSLRAPVDNAPMLVRFAERDTAAKDRCVHAVCLDISASGCRASWPGAPPDVGDAVEVALDVGDWQSETDPTWIPARVARIVSLPFGARQVGFQFALTDPGQIAHVRVWHQAWLRRHRRRVVTGT
jgi:hypothetical protein